MSITQRDSSIDIAKGFGILLMIWGHCAIIPALYGAIYQFHMPLFFVISGYLYKEKDSTTFYKSIYRILLPFFATILLLTPSLINHHLFSFNEIIYNSKEHWSDLVFILLCNSIDYLQISI